MTRLGRAIAIAAQGHADQVDKAGEVYILHPLHVMMRARHHGESAMIVSALHDFKEDCNYQEYDLSFLTDEETFALDCLTKRKSELYHDYLKRVGSSRLACIVKRIDILHNLDLRRLPKNQRASFNTKSHRAKYRNALRSIHEYLGTGTNLEIAWAAGIFDGEGTITIKKDGAPSQLKVSMADEDVVIRFCEAVGAGMVLPDASRPDERKQMYSWYVAAQQDIYNVLSLLTPHFGERRAARAREAMWYFGHHGIGRQNRLKVGSVCKNGHVIKNESDLVASPSQCSKDGIVVYCLHCRRESGRRSKARKTGAT